jgi:hypothetical protein
MKGKQHNWNDVKITLFGREITGIKSVEFKYTLEELHANLKLAESDEDYELCTKIKTLIGNYKE